MKAYNNAVLANIQSEEKGLSRFKTLQTLGQGANGIVFLVQNKATNEKFALKQINLKFLSNIERNNVESEVEFLRVVNGPTVIRFHESFVENQNIYILMEYAEGGSLSDLIQTRRMMNRKFTEEQIFMYTAQLTLSLLLLHSKAILHRDVKT